MSAYCACMSGKPRQVAVFARVNESNRAPWAALVELVTICEGYAKRQGIQITRVEKDDCNNFNDVSTVLERLVADLKHLDHPTILVAQPSQLSPASRLLLKAYKIRLLTALPRSRAVDLGR